MAILPRFGRLRRKEELATLPEIVHGGSVPRILHHIFFHGQGALPPYIADNIAALRARNPGWEYRFYDAEGAVEFIFATYGRDMRDTYLKIDPAYYAARADLLRYLICYAEGGVYLDIKSTALRPLDEVIHPDDVFLLSQWRELRDLAPGEHSKYPMHPELAHVSGSEYVQWFLVCAAGHPFLRAVIEEVLARIDSYSVFMQGVGRMGVLRLTGPIAYTLAIHGIRDRVPHRYVDFEDDLSFVFSVWGDHKSHRKELGTTHYSQLALPIVRGDPLTAAAARAWFGGIQPRLRAARHRSRRLFARFSDRG